MEDTALKVPYRRLYPSDETRELLGGIGKTKYWELVKESILKPVRIGSKLLHTREELDAVIERLVKEAENARNK